MKTRTVCLVFLLLFTGGLNAQNASDILKKMDEVLYACKDQTVKIKMVITDRTGKESVREAETIQKGNSMRLFRFTAPGFAGRYRLSFPSGGSNVPLPSCLWQGAPYCLSHQKPEFCRN